MTDSATELVALVALQEHDTLIDGLTRRQAALPERAAAHALNVRRREAEAALVALAARLEALAVEEAQVEEKLAGTEARAASLEETLRTPGAATRDAQAIMHEVDHLRERASLFEEEGLVLLAERDTVLAEQDEVRAVLDQVARDGPAVLAAVAKAETEVEDQLGAASAERVALAQEVSEALLKTYERLRARLDGVAVARVVAGSCTGCHLSLSASDVARIHKLGAGEHASCEQCDRILVPVL